MKKSKKTTKSQDKYADGWESPESKAMRLAVEREEAARMRADSAGPRTEEGEADPVVTAARNHPLIARVIEIASEPAHQFVASGHDPSGTIATLVASAAGDESEKAARRIRESGSSSNLESARLAAKEVGAAFGIVVGEFSVAHAYGQPALADGLKYYERRLIELVFEYLPSDAESAEARAAVNAEFNAAARLTLGKCTGVVVEPVLLALKGKAGLPIEDWPVANKEGKPAPNSLANVKHYLASRGHVVGFDTFSRRKWVCSSMGEVTRPEPLTERMIVRLWGDMQLVGGTASRNFFHDSLEALCEDRQTNSALEYVTAIEKVWDGQSRIDELFSRYGGVEDTKLHRAWSRAFMLTLVRRIRKPGAELFGFPIFEAPVGGEGKSSFAKALVSPEWFTDSMPLGASPKEVQELGRGKLLVEFSELRGMGQASDFEAIKAMLTRTVDSSRAAYGRETDDIARVFSFIGTTNMREYLRDGGGLRRFWPMDATHHKIDIKGLIRDRDQLWAEAATLEHTVETTNVPEEIFPLERVARESRILRKASVSELMPMLEDIKHGVLPSRAIYEALNDMGMGASFTHQSVELSTMMRNLGFTDTRAKRNGRQQRAWAKGSNRALWFKYDGAGAFVQDRAANKLAAIQATPSKERAEAASETVTVMATRRRGGRVEVDIATESTKGGADKL